MKVSVVIPALNERENLPAAVAAARTALRDAEIVIVDGGSHDGTPDWVRQQRDLRLVRSPTRGRGPQMNAGALAAQATSDVLVFLHADCLLPGSALRSITRAMGDPRTVGGCFPVRFAENAPVSLPITAALINAQSRVRRSATGDQAIGVRRAAWDALGGYEPWPLFEDIAFVDHLKRRFGRRAFAVLGGDAVTISARRWQEFGVARTSLWMCVLWAGYKIGIPPGRLKQWFTDVRPHLKRGS
ncbi:MAG: TIGR04283 family arsenosugar biosynthesis glycosyltransferase [Armatimonadota bacterium]